MKNRPFIGRIPLEPQYVIIITHSACLEDTKKIPYDAGGALANSAILTTVVITFSAVICHCRKVMEATSGPISKLKLYPFFLLCFKFSKEFIKCFFVVFFKYYDAVSVRCINYLSHTYCPNGFLKYFTIRLSSTMIITHQCKN